MAGKMKKRLSEQQEFEVMKLVLDKFLWLGFIIMAFGMYKMFTDTIYTGLTWIVVGAVLLVIFMLIIVKEYEIVR
ncbi:hypothetical protein CEE37_07830 [candidate division LCP-89 bacterium B3_LCP]|uniref:Uncharacterized protein n=1 Tax=candidate division LCP-89 bacterium B3_LCP TaxID=2012998 RepID=A0A532UZ42_UNCL8|nr:MAG: hypothetical protein CEE37_07830 [candidate division LCP-89 bacterium B3_LCP]